MPQIRMINTLDGWVSTDRAAKFGDTRLYIHSTANAYVFFARPRLPDGATVTSAVLKAYPGDAAGSGSVTINVHHLTSAFDPNNLTWTTQPTVGTQVSTLTRVWDGASMDFSITPEVQAIVDGGAWYGWRISTTSTDTTQWIGSGQSTTPMELIIDYTAPPPAPTNLYPAGNATVYAAKPTLSWLSDGGVSGGQMSAIVQVASDAAFTTNLYTSNESTSSASSYDLNSASPAFTALTAGQTRYWRVKVKNTSGVWSAYSAPAQFTYQVAPSLTINTPATTTNDPTPTVSWTLTGATQAAWRLVVSAVDGSSGYWDSGIQYGTTASYDVPQGVVIYSGIQYKITLYSWPTTASAVSLTGAPLYATATKTFTWVPSGATPPVQILATQEVTPLPARLVRWQYTGGTTPARFILIRQRFGVIEQVWDFIASSVLEGGQWYRWVDRLPAGRADVTYSVMTVYADGSTSDWGVNPVVTVKMDHLMPWCISVADPTNKAFCLVNADVNASFSEISDVVRPVGAPAYLAIQSLGKYDGSMSGEISWDAVPGNSSFTGEKMRQNFLWLRQNPRVYLTWQDQAIEAFIYNTDIQSLGTANGKTDYAVSFNFVQV